MDFNVAITPTLSLLIATLIFSIVGDFLVEMYSARMPLSTGRLQAWLFERMGQNLFADYLISISFQFFGFRKKAFFLQMSSFINVGSFTRVQIVILVLGSFVGFGLSALLLISGNLSVGLSLVGLATLFGLFAKEQRRDLSVALLSFGIFIIAIFFFNQFFSGSSFSILAIDISEWTVFGMILFSSILFRTPIPFLITLAVLHLYVGIRIEWFPALLFMNAVCMLAPFYLHAGNGRKRLYFYFVAVVMLQVVQFGLSSVIFQYFPGVLPETKNFLDSYQAVVLSYVVYHSFSLILLTPAVFLLTLIPRLNSENESVREPQKIYYNSSRGSFYSIHFSLFLLRQEFKKFVTSVHTFLKMSRETTQEDSEINQKFIQYQNILGRVSDELKELCFSIGRQRSYRGQIKEVMASYRSINQIELLVEDLFSVVLLLQKNSQTADWERECRFWLGLQLKLFECYLELVVGAGREEEEKIKVQVEKSYEVLNRLFENHPTDARITIDHKTFCRITEGISNLMRY